MSHSLQQLTQQTKRKSNIYFFIKNKHVHPIYKNHSYFEMQPSHKIQLSHHNILVNKQKDGNFRKYKVVGNQLDNFKIDELNQYVNGNNMILSNKANVDRLQTLQKEQLKRTVNIQQFIQSRVRVQTQNQSQKTYKHKNSLYLPHKNYTCIQPTHKYLKNTESFNYRIRKQINFKQQQKNYSPISQSKTLPAEHRIQMTHISSHQSAYSQLNKTITVNLLPYIVNCFLKCKINYHKNLTQNQYNTIISSIISTRNSQRASFDIKDIINIQTLQQLLQTLQLYGKNTPEWQQTIHYFFITNQQILKYQYMKIIQQIKIVSTLKFNIQFRYQNQMYIYRIQDKVLIKNIYDLLKPGTYIFSQSKSVYDIYCAIIKNKGQIQSIKNRVQRWRSIAPLDQTIPSFLIKHKNNSTITQKYETSQQEYKRLYEIRKQNRKKYNKIQHKNIKDLRKQMMITNANSTNGCSFINKSKLLNFQDLFK